MLKKIEPVWQTWKETLPQRPLCADHWDDGVYRRPREEALAYDHVEFNASGRVGWLFFDIDDDRAEPWEQADLPIPNLIVRNRKNGHSHVGYALTAPVGLGGASRAAPIEFLADVQRGMTKRLGADRDYTNRLAKNPESKRWASSWCAPRAYSMASLRDYLDPTDCKRPAKREENGGYSRNCDLFDHLRQYAYANVRSARQNSTLDAWRAKLQSLAAALNTFAAPLPVSEMRAIARSVAKWTWRKYGAANRAVSDAVRDEAYRRGMYGHMVRYGDRPTLAELKPWAAFGCSERTWYRRGCPDPASHPQPPVYPDSQPATESHELSHGLPSGPSEPWSPSSGISRATHYRHRANGYPRHRQTITASSPWTELGISRATYYRRLQSGLIVPTVNDKET